MTKRLFLVQWDRQEAQARLDALQSLGWRVEVESESGARAVKRILAGEPPVVVVIDLQRLPSHGRETGRALRETKAGREIPLLFVGGAQHKVSRVRSAIPDARYCQQDELEQALAALPS